VVPHRLGRGPDTGLGIARLVVLAATALTLLLAGDAIAGARRETEFVVLVLLTSLGVIVLAGANDLLLLVGGYLLTSIPLYALTAFGKTSGGTEAALKQYLLGAFSGVLLLVGVTVLFGAGGATDYPSLAASLPGASRVALVVGVVAILAGLLFELGGVPLHFWVPDVVQAAPAPVAAFVSTVPKIGAALALYRLLDIPLGHTAPDWALLVAVVAAASMTLGNLAAFAQDDVRRLLGYSTVSQVGYLLMAVVAAGRVDFALGSLALYLAAYAVTNLGAFAVVCAFPHARTIADYRGLLRQHRWLALALVVCLLGLVGTPPTAVFAGKVPCSLPPAKPASAGSSWSPRSTPWPACSTTSAGSPPPYADPNPTQPPARWPPPNPGPPPPHSSLPRCRWCSDHSPDSCSPPRTTRYSCDRRYVAAT